MEEWSRHWLFSPSRKEVVIRGSDGPGGTEFTPGKDREDRRASSFLCRVPDSASGALSPMNLALKQAEEKIGFVGLPCQMQALARMEGISPNEKDRLNRVKLKIGLFCTWALDSRGLAGFMKEKGIPISIKKYDIPPPPAQVFRVLTQEG